MAEIRNRHEGTLRWVVASGSGTAWATASAPTSGLLGFVRNFTWNSGRTIQVISDRGTPNHNKLVSKEGITVSFDLAYGITGDYPGMNVSGSGATVPMIHGEFKMTAKEAGAAIYYQFYGLPIASQNFTEGDQENTISFQGVALGMNGPTASGYLG